MNADLDMDLHLIDLLRTVASGFQMRMQQQAVEGAEGLTAFQARLINVIGRNEGISQNDIGARVKRDKAQVARTIKELVALGMVTRDAHPTDGRAKCLSLTDTGWRLHGRLTTLREQLATDALVVLSDDERKALLSGLEKLASALRG